jgi:hypothetical protein
LYRKCIEKLEKKIYAVSKINTKYINIAQEADVDNIAEAKQSASLPDGTISKNGGWGYDRGQAGKKLKGVREWLSLLFQSAEKGCNLICYSFRVSLRCITQA